MLELPLGNPPPTSGIQHYRLVVLLRNGDALIMDERSGVHVVVDCVCVVVLCVCCVSVVVVVCVGCSGSHRPYQGKLSVV